MYLPPRFVEALRFWEIVEKHPKYSCPFRLNLYIIKLHTNCNTSNVTIVSSFLHLCTYQPCIYHSNKWNIYDPFDVSLYVQESYIIYVLSTYKKKYHTILQTYTYVYLVSRRLKHETSYILYTIVLDIRVVKIYP